MARPKTIPASGSVVIRGSGPSFSSGYGILPDDIGPDDEGTRPGIEGDVAAMTRLGAGWARVWDCRIPVIAQVHGNCLAGGTDLALHCDIVVAAERRPHRVPPGPVDGGAAHQHVALPPGPQWTKRLLFTGDTVSGAEAASIGLALEAVPADRLDDHALVPGRHGSPWSAGTCSPPTSG